MSSKRLIIATSVYPPEVGGPGVYFASLKEEMEKGGWTVEIVVRPGFWDLLRRINTPPQTPPLKGGDKEKNIPIILAHATPKILLPVFFARMFKRFKLVIRIGGDFFWERAVEEGRFFGILREFYQNGNIQLWKTSRLIPFARRITFILMKFLLRRANAVVFTTSFLRDIYVPLFGLKHEKVYTVTHPLPNYESKPTTHDSYKSRRGVGIPISLDKNFEASGLSAISYKLLYAGRFLKLKNLEMLLEVFAEALKKHPGLKLTMAGGGPQEHKMRNVCQILDLANYVTFKKPMDHVTILAEIAGSDLVILPSLSDVSPNVLMDALATGTPILATKENGCREIIGDAGVWFDPMSSDDFTAKLEQTLVPGELEKLREKMRNHPYKKTWAEAAEEYERIIS